MGFTTKCFVRKVSNELCDSLTKLGYEDLWTNYIHSQEVKTMTFVNGKGWCLSGFEPYPHEGYIDCGENETLFYFLAALRDDCDSNQLFVNGKGDWGIWRDEVLNGVEWWYLPNDNNINNYHKATKEEIIGIFKNK
jgi:hypothetical protein